MNDKTDQQKRSNSCQQNLTGSEIRKSVQQIAAQQISNIVEHLSPFFSDIRE